MCRYFGIKYEKRFHISEEDALLAGVDVEKENDILIDKSLECADEISDIMIDIENVDILENTIDYDIDIKSNCVPVVGKMRVSITEGTSVDVVTEALTEHDYIITDCMEVY